MFYLVNCILQCTVYGLLGVLHTTVKGVWYSNCTAYYSVLFRNCVLVIVAGVL